MTDENNTKETPWQWTADFAEALKDAAAETDAPNLFEVGDVVTLITGSPSMAVLSACTCGDVEVAWYDESGINIYDFPQEILCHA